ncbi:hypothetical protein [Burkholderia sp. BCC1988]|uniref:hypothetical protein n=1 Tax=Burkholderia sp. BCC1988 TaxID=2817443 RepID=UPI002AAFAEED|nr:hypothetical protein [Burkholderia sp. BCC1988]
MKTYTAKINGAGSPFQSPIGGRVLLIQASDIGPVLTVILSDAKGNRYEVGNVGAAFKAKPAFGFTSVEIDAPAAANVTFIVSDGDVDLQANAAGVTVINTGANPVPVSLVAEPGAPVPVTVQGNVNVTGAQLTATNVGITQAGNAAENAPVPVPAFNTAAPNQVALLAAAAARRAVRFRNAGTGMAYIGGAGVTPSNAVLALNPGDVWTENDAAPAAWFGTSDNGATINIQVLQ